MRGVFVRVVPLLLFAFAVFGAARTTAQEGNAPAPGASSPAGIPLGDPNASAGAGSSPGDFGALQPRRIGGGVSPPRVVHQVPPEFSDEARKKKVGGIVTVNLWVDEHGNPTHVRVVRGVGMGLDEKAVEAVRQYRFAPAMEGGKPVTVELNVEVNFQIFRSPAEADAALQALRDSHAASSNAQAAGSQNAAQATVSQPRAAGSPCGADHPAQQSAADTALAGRKFADAERLYADALAADPASGAAMAGLVRTALAEDKLPEALEMVTKDDSAHPNDAAVLDALGEVRFRRGEVDEAAMAYNRSVNLNPCSGLTHFDMARFLDLSGMHASAQRQLELAHKLAPESQDISRRWTSTHAVPLTPEQTLARLKQRLDSPSLTDDQKEAIHATMAGIEARERGNCELVTPVEEAKLPIVQIPSGSPIEMMYAAGLELQLNGKKRRFEIDSGASGMVLSRSVAKRAGLVPELQVKASGIGDSGPATAFVTHVDDIKIGGMEFKNCMVHVLDSASVLDQMPDVDGLIGLDVFRDYLVTLDTPGFELRLDPLPRRPDEQGRKATLGTSDSDLGSDNGEKPVSIADSAKDRYVAPEMRDWTPVFRSAHFLIFPTTIGKAPTKLFLMDTGASKSMISPAAAREVTILSGFTNNKVQGVSGEVQNLLVADRVSITFARVTQVLTGMQSFDTSGFSRSTGVNISGIIGFPTLRELVISIDYRDNLVHMVYDPKKGYHPGH